MKTLFQEGVAPKRLFWTIGSLCQAFLICRMPSWCESIARRPSSLDSQLLDQHLGPLPRGLRVTLRRSANSHAQLS